MKTMMNLEERNIILTRGENLRTEFKVSKDQELGEESTRAKITQVQEETKQN